MRVGSSRRLVRMMQSDRREMSICDSSFPMNIDRITYNLKIVDGKY